MLETQDGVLCFFRLLFIPVFPYPICHGFAKKHPNAHSQYARCYIQLKNPVNPSKKEGIKERIQKDIQWYLIALACHSLLLMSMWGGLRGRGAGYSLTIGGRLLWHVIFHVKTFYNTQNIFLSNERRRGRVREWESAHEKWLRTVTQCCTTLWIKLNPHFIFVVLWRLILTIFCHSRRVSYATNKLTIHQHHHQHNHQLPHKSFTWSGFLWERDVLWTLQMMSSQELAWQLMWGFACKHQPSGPTSTTSHTHIMSWHKL